MLETQSMFHDASCWSNDGKIFAKLDYIDDCSIHVVCSKDDLLNSRKYMHAETLALLNSKHEVLSW